MSHDATRRMNKYNAWSLHPGHWFVWGSVGKGEQIEWDGSC